MINIAKLLKDAPKGMKLYSPLFGEVNFVGIDKQSDYPINVTDCKGNGKSFTEFGVYFADHPDAECLLFSNKDCRTWEGWTPCVKPKFKVGDWLYPNCNGIYPVLVTDYNKCCGYQLQEGSDRCHLSTKIVEDKYHLWTIADAKDGDVLVDTLSGTRAVIILFRCINADDSINAYCGWNGYTFRVTTDGLGYGTLSSTQYVPATKEQRDLLFKKMKEAGYTWDGEKKELKKIQPHYDIANFHAGMPVLVRDDNTKKWTYTLYSHYDEGDGCPFVTAAEPFIQCIPFNAHTKHLLGTTDMCDEIYINW